jgi:glycolate oxidase iron-sulfur subunit
MSLAEPERALLAGEHGNMLACIRCGQCLTSCPTYVLSMHEAEGPRGRVAMARALLEGHLSLTPDLIEHEDNCLVCDACTAVCPAGVQMDPLQIALRRAIEPRRRRSLLGRLRRRAVFRGLFPHLSRLRLLVRLLWLYQRLGLQRLARRLGILSLLGLRETEALLPVIAHRFLIPRGEVYEPAPPEGGASKAVPQTTVSFFAGCVMSTALADIDHATIRVLQRAGYRVVNVAGQGCCGALNAHGGDLDMAMELAKRTIAAFEGGSDTPIGVNSAGCGAMLKDYAHVFRDDPVWAARAEAFSARIRDATELLAGRDLPLRRQVATTITYQEPCHLAHAQRIRQQPRTLLQTLPGAKLTEMAESTLCCGSAGVYNVTNPRESRQLQRRKLDNALATGAEVIATANPGCLLQLRSGLLERGSNVRVAHIVELLDEATAP